MLGHAFIQVLSHTLTDNAWIKAPIDVNIYACIHTYLHVQLRKYSFACTQTHRMHMPPSICFLTCAHELSAGWAPCSSYTLLRDQTFARERHCTTLLKSLQPFLVLQLQSLRDENKNLCAAQCLMEPLSPCLCTQNRKIHFHI